MNATGFKAKAAVYEKSKLKLTAEVGDTKKYPDWTPDSIAARQKELAALAVKTWPRD